MAQKTFLLVLSSSRQDEATIEHAIDEAKEEGTKLQVLFVMDEKFNAPILKCLAEDGFVGGTLCEEVSKTMLNEYIERTHEKLKEIQDKACQKNVGCEIHYKEGAFVVSCLEIIQEKGVNVVFLSRRKRSKLSRFIFGSELDSLFDAAPKDCRFEILNE